MEYRREIDGLRALAVIPVILFHAGIQSFSGGFVGVDVFFVISGYLITSIIIAEKQANTFTVLSFYERRARRILPALFVVMIACLPFAWFWLLPPDMKTFSQSLVAVSGFASNILFWHKSGYFDTSSELNPLLHTWSLAVEEQYYVIFPVLLSLTWWLGKRWIVFLLSILAVASLAAAHIGAVNSPTATFFSLSTRGWELLIGAFVAFYFSTYSRANHSQHLSQAGSLAGLLLIVYAIFSFDHKTPFPSLYALIPTIGAALIILFSTADTIVGKILGSKLFVGIGLISYSLYLWHQPLFAFARHRSLDEPSQLFLTSLAGVALVLAYLSWKYVETPFRNRQRFDRNKVFLLAGIASISFVTLGLVGHFNNGFESRLTSEQRAISAFSRYDYSALYSRNKCFLDPEKTYLDFSKECQQTVAGEKTLLILGDSYAAALSAGLRVVHRNVIQYSASACPPVIETEFSERPHCLHINKFAMREIARLKPADIFLHANWQIYKKESAVKNIRKTIEHILTASPSSRITVVGSVPHWEPTLPIFAIRKNVSLAAESYLFMPTYKGLKEVDDDLRAATAGSGAEFKSALDYSCRADKCLVVVSSDQGFQLTSWDSGHLTKAGAISLAKKLLATPVGDGH